MGKKYHKESQVIKDIIQVLQVCKHFVMPNNSDVRHGKFNTRYVSGTPDLTVLLNTGETIYIEVKLNDKGKLTLSQEKVKKELTKRGARFYVASGDNWMSILKEFHDSSH